MISRRSFNKLALPVGFSWILPSVINAQGKPTIRMGNATGTIDSQLAFFTVGQNPKTPFYAQEGVNVEIVTLSAAAQALQALTAGHAEISAIPPFSYLNVIAKSPNLDVVFPYTWLRQQPTTIGVREEAPFKTLVDLKGKVIGIGNQGDASYILTRAMFKEVGLNPEKDVEWLAVGYGGPAGLALKSGRVDAVTFSDAQFARIELAGFKQRMLPNAEGATKLTGNGWGVRRSDLAKNRDIYVRFFRANAKSTVFAYANPEAAIKLHWETYPESKPKGLSDSDAMRDALFILNARKGKWYPAAWQADKRFGATNREEWQAQVRYADLEAQITEVDKFFTNDLLDEVNKFDVSAIERMALSM